MKINFPFYSWEDRSANLILLRLSGFKYKKSWKQGCQINNNICTVSEFNRQNINLKSNQNCM